MSLTVSDKLVSEVRLRARDVCEYCKIPNSWTLLNFEVDPVIAVSPQGDNSLDKLAWACAHCNLKKGTNFAAIDPHTAKKVALFDPRSDNWLRHFTMSHGVIKARSAKARATLSLLEMNLDWYVAVRREHYLAIELD